MFPRVPDHKPSYSENYPNQMHYAIILVMVIRMFMVNITILMVYNDEGVEAVSTVHPPNLIPQLKS